MIGEAGAFDGNDYINIERNPSLEGLPGLTIMAWAYPANGIDNCDVILCKEDEFVVGWKGDASLTCAVQTNSANWFWTGGTGSNTFPLEKWSFVAITWDGAYIREYINGELKNAQAQPGATTRDENRDIRIGGRQYYSNAAWQGKIDEVKLYKRALSDAEIRAQYNSNISITFTDGLGRPIQAKNRVEDAFIVSRTEYNTIGEVYREYKPQKINNDTYYYIPPSVFNSDTCETYTYYDDPLKRLKKQTHYNNDYIEYVYGAGTELNGTNYLYRKVRDENSIAATTYIDKFGNKIGGFNAHTNNDEIKWTQQYDILGNMITNQPPNHWTTDETNPPQWDSEIKYNTLGQVYQKTTPDEGTVKYIYDLNGNLRYSQTAVQAANGDNFTVYYYDQFNRVTSIGEEKDQDWLWSLNVNNTTWGKDSDEWKVKNYYDENYVPETSNFCQNRLAKVEINEDSDNAAEHTTLFVYDEYGNVIEKRITIDSGAPLSEKIIRFEYDLMGNEKKIIYPSGNTIIKQYNRQGQIKKISAVN
jgi:YD repeat-containing protein